MLQAMGDAGTEPERLMVMHTHSGFIGPDTMRAWYRSPSSEAQTDETERQSRSSQAKRTLGFR